MLNGVIKQIEKGKPFFDKIAQNIYLGAVRDGFLTAMPAILFSSVFILAASIPEIGTMSRKRTHKIDKF